MCVVVIVIVDNGGKLIVGVVRVFIIASMEAAACDACYWLERVVASGGSASGGDGGLSLSTNDVVELVYVAASKS